MPSYEIDSLNKTIIQVLLESDNEKPVDLLSFMDPENRVDDSNLFRSDDKLLPKKEDNTQPVNTKEFNQKFDPDTYGLVLDKMTSGLFIDDLVILKTLQHERNLLSKLGLNIEPTDKSMLIKDEDGNIKGAIAINQVLANKRLIVKYLDVDPQSENFTKVLTKMNDVSGFVKYYEDVSIERIPIDSKYIQEDV